MLRYGLVTISRFKVTGWFGETERVFYKSRSHSALQVPRRDVLKYQLILPDGDFVCSLNA